MRVLLFALHGVQAIDITVRTSTCSNPMQDHADTTVRTSTCSNPMQDHADTYDSGKQTIVQRACVFGSSQSSNEIDDAESSESDFELQVRIGARSKPTESKCPAQCSDSALPTNAKIEESLWWACFRVPDLICPKEKVIDQRQNSLVISFKRRFSERNCKFEKSWFAHPGCPVIDVQETPDILTLGHFSAKCVVVNSEGLKQEFTAFCENQTWIAIDTESAPMNSSCDLVQIGNDEVVYLIAVAKHRDFLSDIVTLLASNRERPVFQFGADDFQKIAMQVNVRDIQCEVIDVQFPRSTDRAHLISLGDLYSTTFPDQNLVLSKTWRISGWDNPVLYSRQEEYAALDVVCLSKLAKFYHSNACKK